MERTFRSLWGAPKAFIPAENRAGSINEGEVFYFEIGAGSGIASPSCLGSLAPK